VGDRRAFIAALTGALAGPASLARAQRATRVWRVGVLAPGTSTVLASGANIPSPVLVAACQELGYAEGKNVAYVVRTAGGAMERLPVLAAELVAGRVDVIVTAGSEATRAAKQATKSIPIVFLGPSYPVEEGLVASFAHPGGNVTGITNAHSDHTSKQLQFLRDVVPALTNVAVVWDPANPGTTFMMRDVERAGEALHTKIQSIPIRSPDESDPALATIARLRSDGLIVLPGAIVNAHLQRLCDLALKLRVPSISPLQQYAEQGLLLSYGADIRNLVRRIADHVDRILKGTKPADLPIERPTKFELVINLKTAKALGLVVPQSLLLRADRVIE
jgi:putative ABC transport system substrate-binding protein